jgi:hypothetical protein
MDSVGAMYIGLLISTVYVLTLLCYIALADSHRDSLYGVACIQTWQYYMQYPRDSLGLKALVAAVWISDTVNLSLSCASIWNYVIANYANPAYLIVVDRPLVVQVLFNVRLCLPVSVRRHVLGINGMHARTGVYCAARPALFCASDMEVEPWEGLADGYSGKLFLISIHSASHHIYLHRSSSLSSNGVHIHFHLYHHPTNHSPPQPRTSATLFTCTLVSALPISKI